ncbi:MAG TPA: hemerythrin domain-containing protein [Aeromicrobium sp.]|nr:hemerythrin domain-containing protein [Aeromicrobium sp.]
MSDQGLSRPTGGDVIDLILDDHATFEALLRRLRGSHDDRAEALRMLATLHVAHAEAEESQVYPKLRRKGVVDEEEAEHGEHEHAEAHQALLAVMELSSLSGDQFDAAVEELTSAISHHLAEEELTILDPARDDVTPAVRGELGRAFCEERNRLIDSDCGTIDVVRDLVDQAEDDGLIESD